MTAENIRLVMKKLVLILPFLCSVFLYSTGQDFVSGAETNVQPRQAFMTRTGNKVTYHLYVTDTIVNYTGKNVKAIAINGRIPAPELHFTEGDSAEIHVHNLIHMETSI